jgi:hypothetical protein
MVPYRAVSSDLIERWFDAQFLDEEKRREAGEWAMKNIDKARSAFVLWSHAYDYANVNCAEYFQMAYEKGANVKLALPPAQNLWGNYVRAPDDILPCSHNVSDHGRVCCGGRRTS